TPAKPTPTRKAATIALTPGSIGSGRKRGNAGLVITRKKATTPKAAAGKTTPTPSKQPVKAGKVAKKSEVTSAKKITKRPATPKAEKPKKATAKAKGKASAAADQALTSTTIDETGPVVVDLTMTTSSEESNTPSTPLTSLASTLEAIPTLPPPPHSPPFRAPQLTHLLAEPSHTAFRRAVVPSQQSSTVDHNGAGANSHSESYVLTDDTLVCVACRTEHRVGHCPLKLAGVEYCNLCGIAHFGQGRICPHIGSETQVRAMLDALKHSNEPEHLVREATKYLKSLKGNLVQLKKQKAAREYAAREEAAAAAAAFGMQGMGNGYDGTNGNVNGGMGAYRAPPLQVVQCGWTRQW
ncbi:hypothetical protein LTR95_012345, partial [Oleoguttula sp. CCFEE 5521]